MKIMKINKRKCRTKEAKKPNFLASASILVQVGHFQGEVSILAKIRIHLTFLGITAPLN